MSLLTSQHYPSSPVEAYLRQRGFEWAGRGDPKVTVSPLRMNPSIITHDGVFVHDWDDTYYNMLGHPHFRKLLRHLLRNKQGSSLQEMERVAEAKTSEYLEFLRKEDVCYETSGNWAISLVVDNFGPTFERYVAAILQREYACPAEWGVRLEGFPSGDLDVIAISQGTLLYVECKTQRPTDIENDEIEHFAERVSKLGTKFSVLLIDTEVTLECLIPRLRPHFSGSMRSDKQPIEFVCIDCRGTYIFVSNAKPSLKKALGMCLRYYGRNIAESPFPP